MILFTAIFPLGPGLGIRIDLNLILDLFPCFNFMNRDNGEYAKHVYMA